jgi:hypothetical protein
MMKLVWFLPLLFLTLAIPVRGQSKVPSKVDSLLTAASEHLNDYQQHIAPNIRCGDETDVELRAACGVYLEKANSAAQDAATKISNYSQLASPQNADLFDIYEDFHRIMEYVQMLAASSDAYELHNQQNHVHIAETYNDFVKLTPWFGGIVRESIQQADKPCPDRVN